MLDPARGALHTALLLNTSLVVQQQQGPLELMPLMPRGAQGNGAAWALCWCCFHVWCVGVVSVCAGVASPTPKPLPLLKLSHSHTSPTPTTAGGQQPRITLSDSPLDPDCIVLCPQFACFALLLATRLCMYNEQV